MSQRTAYRARVGHARLKRLPRGTASKRRGVALILALIAILFLTASLTDMLWSSTSAHAASISERDSLRAEYAAKGALNLTRLVMANRKAVASMIAPMYRLIVGKPLNEIPVYNEVDSLLKPFCTADNGEDEGFALDSIEGIGDTKASCTISASAENGKINLNKPLLVTGDDQKRSLAMQIYALTGGYQLESPYDELFSGIGRDGQIATRQDVVASIIDWWDYDTQRTFFDVGRSEVTTSGSEDNPYSRLDDPYQPKNTPFDSLEELRLVHGVDDDFWSTFIEPKGGDPKERLVTIYGSGWVNPNDAPPQVILPRVCSIIPKATLCTDPAEASKFIQLVNTARGFAQQLSEMIGVPVVFFPGSNDFVNFIAGQGGPRDLYPMLLQMLGPGNPLLFTPVTMTDAEKKDLTQTIVTTARIIGLQVKGRSGRAEVTIDAVLNFHESWTPPPPNPGGMPPLGIFHYYRIR